jgi:hypothetical protein
MSEHRMLSEGFGHFVRVVSHRGAGRRIIHMDNTMGKEAPPYCLHLFSSTSYGGQFFVASYSSM